jgi:hypothetical protein
MKRPAAPLPAGSPLWQFRMSKHESRDKSPIRSTNDGNALAGPDPVWDFRGGYGPTRGDEWQGFGGRECDGAMAWRLNGGRASATIPLLSLTETPRYLADRIGETQHVEPLFILGVIALIIVAALLSYLSAQKRRQAMMALAARLGLRFDPGKNRSLAERYSFLNKLRAGANRYALNTLTGGYQGHEVAAFDYHYETHSTDAKGHRQTHHHYFSVFLLHLPGSFPELVIGREGFFSKVAQALGYDDIDFESHEFSRRFCVRSKDKKFAYDVCNARMIEYLLANDDLTIEIDSDTLALTFPSRLDPERIELNLGRLVALRARLPDYLFSRSTP